MLANTSAGGAVHAVVQQFDSHNAHYLEGEVRAVIDGRNVALSSGTEDFYLSAFYFDAGEYQTPLAGLTFRSSVLPTETTQASAYRVFDGYDPLVFEHNLTLTWRNGEPSTKLQPTTTTLDAYVFVYEW